MDGVKHHFMASKYDVLVRKYKHQQQMENIVINDINNNTIDNDNVST